MSSLADKKCVPCEGGAQPLTRPQSEELLSGLPGWVLAPDAKLIKAGYVMKNFRCAVDLINKIMEIAESENHHPDLHLTSYRKLTVELSTHAIGGLSENDFILAAKIDKLPKQLKT